MFEDEEIDKEIPDGADELVTFSGGLYEFETSAGWTDKWPQLTKEELLSRNSFGSDKERLANKEIDKEIPDGADELVTFSGGLYEFETSAGWTDKWPQLTKEELLSRNSFGSDKERLANNKWLDKFISKR